MTDFPHDLQAEAAVLGACLLSDAAIDAVSGFLSPSDFFAGRNGNIYRSILAVHEHGRVDPITVAADLAATGHTGEHYSVGALHALTIDTPTVSNAAQYAHIIVSHATRVRIIKAAADATELAWSNTDAGAVLDAVHTRFADLELPTGGTGRPDHDFVAFMEQHSTEYDWLIPGFLERKDRLILTAGEGAGKSTLLTQLAFMSAAGLHVWTQAPIPPINVALIDLENPQRLVSRRLGFLRAAAAKASAIIEPSRLRVCSRPEGLDLTTTRDRHWLIDRCIANGTELLVIGPVYRMFSGAAARGDTGGEDQARGVTKALDEVRHRCGVTLAMETHAPHAGPYGRDLRPFGSSVWLRWPEFGIGLRRDDDEGMTYAVEHWRGARDQRAFPHVLQKGGKWPWTATMKGHTP